MEGYDRVEAIGHCLKSRIPFKYSGCMYMGHLFRAAPLNCIMSVIYIQIYQSTPLHPFLRPFNSFPQKPAN